MTQEDCVEVKPEYPTTGDPHLWADGFRAANAVGGGAVDAELLTRWFARAIKTGRALAHEDDILISHLRRRRNHFRNRAQRAEGILRRFALVVADLPKPIPDGIDDENEMEPARA